MATDWDSIVAKDQQRGAVGNVAQSANVTPQVAVDALNAAPASRVPADVAMHAPDEPLGMARFRDQTAILKNSPEVTSFIQKNAAIAAATKDDFSSLAGIAHTVNRWNDIATEDFFAPGRAAGRALIKDASDWFQMSQSGNSPLDMIPGFSAKDQKLGHVLADIAGVVFSPASGALYAAARPFSYLPLDNKAPAARQADIANIFGVASMGVRPGVGRFEPVPPVNEGSFGAPKRLTGPKENVPDADFTDIAPPGVDPSHTPLYVGVAEMDAANVQRMQEAVAAAATTTRSPQLMIEYLNEHTAAKGQTVAVPAETIAELWQQGHKPFQDMSEQVAAALKSGHDVQVPLGQYLTETAGQPFAEELLHVTRFRQNGVSLAEGKELPTAEAEDLAPMAEEISGKPGVNVRRMAGMLGPQLYGDPENIAAVTAKEVLQNSFDAIKALGGTGNLHVHLDEVNRKMIFTDSGSGMAPDLLGGKFLQIAGSEKGENASGGFGIAKMLFLYGNKDLHVVTMKDGVVSEMRTSGPDLMNALEEGGVPPTIQIRRGADVTTADRELFPEGHGTHISLQIPETYNDTKTGTEKSIPFPYSVDEIPAFKNSPLFADVSVTKKGYYDDSERTPLKGIGKTFKAEDYTTFANVKFGWGTARIYISKEPIKYPAYDGDVHVLSNGLWQFTERLSKDPNDMYAKALPYRIYVDVNPNVKPEQAGYPFGFNRQAFTEQAKKDMRQIKTYIQASYGSKMLAEGAADFGSVKYISKHVNDYSQDIDIKPEVPQTPNSFDRFKEGDKVEVRDGKLIINGEEIPALTPEELKKNLPKAEELKVPQERIDPNRVMVHDNTIGAGEDTADNPFPDEVSFSWAMRKKYGEQWVRMERLVGTTFIELRNAVAELMNYPELQREAIGVSYDKDYRGVSIKVPFSGMFINPVVAESGDPVEAAFGIMGTMIHELAHFKVRSHNADFPAEMQRITYKLQSHAFTQHKGEENEDFHYDFQGAQERFVEQYLQHQEMLADAREEFLGGRFKNSGRSFSDGSREGSDAGGEGDTEGLAPARQGREGGSGVPDEAGRGGSAGGDVGGGAGVQPGDGRVAGLVGEIQRVTASAGLAAKQVEAELGLNKVFEDPKAASLTKGQFNVYDSRLQAWEQEVAEKLAKKMVRQFYHEHSTEWKTAVALHTEEAKALIENQPNVKAWQALRDPMFKLDTEQLETLYPDLSIAKTLHKQGGLAPDDAAELLGYDSGAALVEDMHHLSTAIEAAGGQLATYINARAKVYAEEQSRQMLGYDVSPQGILDAVRESITSDKVEDLLIEPLKTFADQNGLPFDKAQVKIAAKEQFDNLPVREGVKTKAFIENMRRLGNKAEQALAEGRIAKAFTYKQQQLIQYHQLSMSQFLAKKVEVSTRKFAKLGRRKAIKGMSQAFLDQIHAYLPRIDIPMRRNRLELEEALGGQTVEQFVNGVIAQNPVFPDVPSANGPIKDMTVDDFWQVRAFVYAMDKYGREVQTLKTTGDKLDFNDTVERFLANIPPGGKPPVVRMGGRKNYFERQQARFRGYDASHRKIADIGEFFDQGDPKGVMAEVLEYPIEAAADKDGALRRDIYKPVNDAFWKIPARSSYNAIIKDHPFTAPGGGKIEVRRGDVPAVAVYVGQESSLAKLAEGYNTTAVDVLAWLDKHITQEEVDFVQKIWDQFDLLSVEVSAELRAMTGTGLQREAFRPWETKFGTMRGGYWPVKYDKALDDQAKLRELGREIKVGLDPVNQFFADVIPNKGFAVTRTGYKGPVLIRLADVAGAFDAHIKYASYAQTIASIRRFIKDRRVRAAITNRMGKEYYDQFNPWLDAVVLDYTVSDKGATALQAMAHQLRINMTMAVLGFSYTTGISQVAGFEAAAGILGEGPLAVVDGHLRMAHGAAKFGRNVLAGKLQTEIFDKSEFMAQRFGQVEPNMVDAINASQGLSYTGGTASEAYKAIQHAGLAYIGWMEFLTATGPAWTAAMDKARGSLGMTEGDAIRYADRIVRKSQGSGRRVDLAAVQRGEGFQKWFYQFNTWYNAQYNRMVETGREFAKGNYGKGFALFTTIFVISPLLASVLTNHGPKDNDPDTVAKWAAQTIFFNLFRPIMLLGNATSTLDRNLEVVKGKWQAKSRIQDWDWSADPTTRMFSAIGEGVDALMKASDHKKVRRPVQTAASAIGLPLGIPGALQLGKTGEYLHELTTRQQRPKNLQDYYEGLTMGPQKDQGS